MNNLFDTDNYLDTEPTELVSGDRWAWTRSDITAAYETASYTLKYRFYQLDSCGEFFITAGKVSSAHVVEVPQAVTAGYESDEYGWEAIVVRDSDSEEVTVTSGFATVRAGSGGTDGTYRGWVYATLSAIRATIKGTASTDQESYSINGRSLSRRSPEELMALEKEFSARWQSEKDKSAIDNGKSVSSRVLVKMSA